MRSVSRANEFSSPIMTFIMFLVFFTKLSNGSEIKKCVARASGMENYAKFSIVYLHKKLLLNGK